MLLLSGWHCIIAQVQLMRRSGRMAACASCRKRTGRTALGQGSRASDGSARMRSLPSGQHFTLQAHPSALVSSSMRKRRVMLIA